MSQFRRTCQEEGYIIISIIEGDAILENEDGKFELWREHDDNPSFTIEIDGVGYEFIRSIAKDDVLYP